jgi:tetrahydromethanopterin S-methyltransferase subunit F
MEDRFKGLIESFLVIIILLVIYWTLGFIIKKIFNFEIRNKYGYIICIIGGFILKRVLVIILKN